MMQRRESSFLPTKGLKSKKRNMKKSWFVTVVIKCNIREKDAGVAAVSWCGIRREMRRHYDR